jgi:hypothetical protein
MCCGKSSSSRLSPGWLLPLFFGGCLAGGCKSNQPNTFEQNMVLIEKMGEVASKNNMAMTIQFEGDLEPSFYMQSKFGIGTRAKVIASFQANADDPPK